ncbi:hypothetical protein, partial [Bilophila wadsworthia]|uniref:hypothetical protein n=1 Tax=Bilophila wadsworthia TaxID=35833 RepID=UPI0032618F86
KPHPILSQDFRAYRISVHGFPCFSGKGASALFYLVKTMERQEEWRERERERERERRKALSGKFGRGLVFIINVKLLQIA